MEGQPERDVKDFEFRQLCKFRLFTSAVSHSQSPKRVQKLATSSKFGIIFAASHTEINVLHMTALTALDSDLGKQRSTTVLDAPVFMQFSVPGPVVHLGISSDELTLSVVVDDMKTLTLLAFDIHCFGDQSVVPTPLLTYQLARGGLSLLDLAWNPGQANLLALCLSDGSVSVLDVTTTLTVVASLAAGSGANCLSWSPRGKKLMLGKLGGTCAQCSLDLKEEKHWAAPGVLASPHNAIDIVWVSAHTFLAAYLPQACSPDTQPLVILTESAKDGRTSYLNFDDICFGSGSERKAKYYFAFVPQWEMIIMSSSNATETTIVARHFDQKLSWEHWNLEDSSRAELPVTDDQTDSFPLGMSLSFSSQQLLQLGDNKTHPACPVLLLLSTDGVLVPFHMVYHHSQAPSLTVTPQPLCAQSARKPLTGPAHQLGVATAQLSTSQSLGGLLVQPLSASQSLGGLLVQPLNASGTSGLGPPPVTKPATGFAFSQLTTASSMSDGAGLFGKPLTASGGGTPLFAPGSAQTSGLLPPPSGVAGNLSSAVLTALPSGAASSRPGANQGAEPSFSTKLAAPSAGKTGFFSGAGISNMQKTPATTTAATGASSSLPVLGAVTSDVAQQKAADKGPLQFSFSLPKSIASDTETAKAFTFGMQPTGKTTSDNPSLVNQKSSTAPQQLLRSTVLTPGGAGGDGQFPFQVTQSPGALAPRPQQPSNVPAATGAGSSSFALTPNRSGVGLSMQSAVPPPPSAKLTSAGSSHTAQAVTSQPAQSLLSTLAASVGKASVAAVGEISSARVAGGNEDSDINEIVNSTINKNIIEEIEDFEAELRTLRQRTPKLVPAVGTKEEMDKLHQAVRRLVVFCKEGLATTKEQSFEVRDLKSSCLDLFAMAEDCRARIDRHKDPRYTHALQQRALDPASAKRLQSLRQFMQMVSQSLEDADSILDAQWEEHVGKETKTRIRVPTSNTIYRAIKSNHNIIVRQQSAVEQIKSQLGTLQVKSVLSPQDLRGASAASGVESHSQPPPRNWRVQKQDVMTPEKVTLLREALSSHAVRKVNCAHLDSLSMSRLVNIRDENRASSVNSTVQAGNINLRDSSEGSVLTCAADSTHVISSLPPPMISSTPALSLPAARESRSEEAPTVFSGVGFFKPKVSEVVPAVAKIPSSWMSAVAGNKSSSTPGPLVFNSNSGAVFSLQQTAATSAPGTGMLPQTPPPPPAPKPFAVGRVQVSAEEGTVPGLHHVASASLTGSDLNDEDAAGDTDENNDEYGYEEDDEEEEEDEEEAGFGDQYEYPQGDSTLPADFLQSVVLTPGAPSTTGTPPKPFSLAAATCTSSASAAVTTSSSGTSSASVTGQTGAAAGNGGPPFGSGSSLFAGSVPSFSALADAERKHISVPPTLGIATEKSIALGMSSAGTTTAPAVCLFSGFGLKTESSATGSGLFTMSNTTTASSTGGSQIGDIATSKTTTNNSSSVNAASAPSASAPSAASTSISSKPASAGVSSVPPSAIATSVPLSANATFISASSLGEEKPTATPASTSVSTCESTPVCASASTAPVAGEHVLETPSSTAPTPSSTPLSPTSAPGAGLGGTPVSASTTSTSYLFGAVTAGDAASAPSQFGTTTPGQPATTTSVFVATSAPPASSVFGNLSGISSSSTSSPGFATATSGPAGSSGTVFGMSSGPTAPTTSIFGTSAPVTTALSGMFGTSSSVLTAPTGSIFGTSAPSAVFGTPAGGPVASTSTAFGASGTGASASSHSIFQTSTSAAGSGSRPVFGDGAAPSSIFGSSSPTSGGSVFGGSAASAGPTSGATFGFSQSSLGGFGKPAFGAGPAFGQSPSGFGQGVSAGFSQGSSSAFGSSSSVFGQPAASKPDSSVAFGGLFAGSGDVFGLGAKHSEEKAKQNVFGGTQSFGATSSGPAMFGKQETSAFGSAATPASTGGLFAASSFSSGSGSVASMGFAVSQPTSGTDGGFGSTSVFGSAPSFGGSPGFGSAPTFGSSPSLGATPSFGGSSGFSNVFASPGTTGGGFGSFGSSGGPTFGSLAQSSDAPSFGTLSQSGPGGFGGLAGQAGTGTFGSQSTGFASSQSGFGTSAFGSSPSFSAYRG